MKSLPAFSLNVFFEFTATPTENSNILYNVSASQLKHEQMIKLPIVLTEHQNWEEAIQDAILTRTKLAEIARNEPDFVRPIVLIQAEEKGREVTVEVSGFDLVERAQLKIEKGRDNRLLLRVSGEVTPELEQKIMASVQEGDRLKVGEAIAEYRIHPKRALLSAERGEPFIVPQLSLLVNGEPELAEYALDDHLWNLLDYPAELNEQDFTIEEKATSYEFDIRGEQLTYKFLGKQLPLDFGDTESGLTDLQLTRWLEPRLRQPNIRPETLLEFTRQTLRQLLDNRNIPLVTLVRGRFQLLKALALKIKDHQVKDSKANYQALLFGDHTSAETSYDYSFQFDPKSYPANSFYQGRYEIGRHYYGNMIGAFDNDEEMDCARDIAQCKDVKFWVRNLVHDTWAFRLPLSNGKFFYPDFVAMLNDGRIFVIEYKGAHLVEGSQEKQNIGELWEEKSGGKALFLMAVKRDEKGRSVYKQIEDKIEGKF